MNLQVIASPTGDAGGSAGRRAREDPLPGKSKPESQSSAAAAKAIHAFEIHAA
jgi:hypothetical protein